MLNCLGKSPITTKKPPKISLNLSTQRTLDHSAFSHAINSQIQSNPANAADDCLVSPSPESEISL